MEERSEECVKHTGDVLPSRTLIKMGYVMGATEQREIDIEKACEWLSENFNKVLLKSDDGEVVERLFTYEVEERFKKVMEE